MNEPDKDELSRIELETADKSQSLPKNAPEPRSSLDTKTIRITQPDGDVQATRVGDPDPTRAHLLIADKYRVIAEIGKGGMGTVLKVEQVYLKKQLALKKLHSSSQSQLEWQRFQKEAQAISRLDHANLVKIFDYGVDRDNEPFLVMDLIDGETLSGRLHKLGSLDVSEAVAIFVQVCAGLAHAHDNGVIHRDIKPSNIILQNPGDVGKLRVKIVDFGLAKLFNDEKLETQSLTKEGDVFGTPLYMSPEQCIGARVDHRSDIYSVGCAMFESLTGAPPFTGDNSVSTMVKHQLVHAPTLKEASLGKEFPQALENVVAKLLAKKAEDRYQDFRDVSEDLSSVLHQGAQRDTADEGTTSGVARKPYRKSSTYAFISFTGILAVVSLILFSFKFHHAPRQERPSAHQPPASVSNGSFVDSDDAMKRQDALTAFSGDASTHHPHDTRVFKFPNFSIGTIDTNATLDPVNEQTKRINAINDVVIHDFKPFAFEPSWQCCQRPSLIERFNPDEIWSLTLSKSEHSEDLLSHARNLTALTRVFASFTDLTDEHLRYLDELPNLDRLEVSDTDVTGVGLSKLNRLHDLKQLGASYTKNGSLVVKALNGSKAIENLDLGGTGLTAEDMPGIGRLTSLKVLEIPKNHITDQSLKYLEPLTQLRRLSIFGNPLVTPRCIQYLKALQGLKTLDISGVKWTDEQKKQLHDAMPNCKDVVWNENQI
ncbi:MAG TPA: protein kinase [Trichormus sp.]